MDFLDKIFKIQNEQNKYWYDPVRFKVDKEYRVGVIKDYVLGIYEQTSSLMNTIDWKKHLLTSEENRYNSKMQLIDIIKYSIGLLIFEGVNVDEFYTLFDIKSKLLDSRWKQQKIKMTLDTKVAIFDIDGCIADYPGAYEKYLENIKGLKPVIETRTSYYFYERYGITKQQEEIYHSEFIESGGFLDLEFYSESLGVINKLIKNGIKIVLLTARPSWIHKRIFGDTFKWLLSHHIPYDLLLWDKDKADATVKHVFPAKILFMVEDRDKHAIEMAHIGVPVMLLDKEYNQSLKDTENVERVKNWMEINNRVNGILSELKKGIYYE